MKLSTDDYAIQMRVVVEQQEQVRSLKMVVMNRQIDACGRRLGIGGQAPLSQQVGYRPGAIRSELDRYIGMARRAANDGEFDTAIAVAKVALQAAQRRPVNVDQVPIGCIEKEFPGESEDLHPARTEPHIREQMPSFLQESATWAAVVGRTDEALQFLSIAGALQVATALADPEVLRGPNDGLPLTQKERTLIGGVKLPGSDRTIDESSPRPPPVAVGQATLDSLSPNRTGKSPLAAPGPSVSGNALGSLIEARRRAFGERAGHRLEEPGRLVFTLAPG